MKPVKVIINAKDAEFMKEKLLVLFTHAIVNKKEFVNKKVS